MSIQPTDPFDSTLHDVVLGPLDLTVDCLQSLSDSQASLIAQLDALQRTIDEYRLDTKPELLKETLAKIKEGKLRMRAINDALTRIADRVNKVLLKMEIENAAAEPPRRVLG